MKNLQTSLLSLLILLIVQLASGQPNGLPGFSLTGKNQGTIKINQRFTASAEIFPFGNNPNPIFGLAMEARIVMNSNESIIRIVLIDQFYNEFLVYEVYPLLESVSNVTLNKVCEETGLLNSVKPYSLKIEITDGMVDLNEITVATEADTSLDVQKTTRDKKQAQNDYKVKQLNKNIREKGQSWAAGITEVSEMNFSDRKKLYGQSKFPAGFEYYTGGIIQTGETLKSAAASAMVDNWDWRNRHGKNWITSVKNQGGCGSCWAFAVTGATEAQVNLFFNQPLNLNLSEQDVLSCSGAGSCSGGYPSIALDYVKNTGIVNEEAFPYKASNLSCSGKSPSPSQLIKIAGRVDFGSTTWPKTEDNLKKMIIKYGPISGGLYDWSHAMTLVGWKVVKQGDYFYTRDLNKNTYWITIPAGSPLIGTTVWIFKNSWGSWGDAGYVYVQTNISNFGWTHALLNPVQSLKQSYSVTCVDSDNDGYYWWGLGPKPLGCSGPDTPDGNDNNSGLGPLDEYGNCIPLNNPPVASFTSDKTIVTQGSAVTFTDKSTNSPTSWKWRFNGGTPATSTLQNPVVVYNTIGTFDVILTATNLFGSGTVTQTGYIKVNQPVPVVNFTANKTTISPGESVSFTDQSTNSPTSWNWQFSGGTPSSSALQNPVVNYFTAGVFNVTLTAVNTGGPGTLTKTGYITVIPPAPVADFSSDKTIITQGQSIVFQDMSTNTPTSWNWQFSGGTPVNSSLQNPVIAYYTPGNYTVSLTSSNLGGSGTVTKTGLITVNALTYCNSSGITYTNEWIKEIKFNNIVNSSGGSGYSDFTNIKFNVTPGKSCQFTLTPGYKRSQAEFWAIWVDVNMDGDFTDSGEKLFSTNKKNGAVNGTFIVPANIKLPTRMRISMKHDAAPSPCGVFPFGEVEDYTLTGSGSGVSIIKSAEIEKPVVIADNNINLYPNPAREYINLRISGIEGEVNYIILNSQGLQVFKQQIVSDLTRIPVNRLASGLYLVVVENGNRFFISKFIKE